jgi:hypothetical protein
MASYRARHSTAAAVLLCTVILTVASAELLQVQVLHRHGAREHLQKSPTSPSAESAGSRLLVAGTAQLIDLGATLRARYLLAGTAGGSVIAGSATNYSGPPDVYAVSSDTDRTLASSLGFLKGLYPDDAGRIPTHVFNSSTHDWLLRGYTLCPNLNAAIEKFVTGKVVTDKGRQVDSAGGLARAASIIKEDPQLPSAFNVFDWFLLSRSGYAGTVRLPPISDGDFSQVAAAANWIETQKYAASDIAGQYIAGALLNRFVNESEKMLSGNSAQQYPPARRMIEYSGHYPILLGVLAALQLDGATFGSQEGVKTTIPSWAAALIWELHTGGEVRLFWRQGIDAPIEPIPCDSKGSYSCSVASLKSRLRASGAPANKGDFCSLCGSSSTVNPDLCPVDTVSKRDRIERSSVIGAGIGGGLLGLVVGITVAMCLLWRCGFPMRRKTDKHASAVADSASLTKAYHENDSASSDDARESV